MKGRYKGGKKKRGREGSEVKEPPRQKGHQSVKKGNERRMTAGEKFHGRGL